MVFFKEEITNFQLAYFEKTCAALDSEKEMQYYCRDVFRNGKDALDRITLDLTHRYMFDTKYKVPRWGLVDIPHDLIDQCAARILAKVVVLRRLQAEEETRRQAEEKMSMRRRHERLAKRRVFGMSRRVAWTRRFPVGPAPSLKNERSWLSWWERGLDTWMEIVV